MKRSEMLQFIEIVLTAPRLEWDVKAVASEILDGIEKKGMLPPYNPQHLDHGSIVDCEWTPEIEIKELPDETK